MVLESAILCGVLWCLACEGLVAEEEPPNQRVLRSPVRCAVAVVPPSAAFSAVIATMPAPPRHGATTLNDVGVVPLRAS